MTAVRDVSSRDGEGSVASWLARAEPFAWWPLPVLAVLMLLLRLVEAPASYPAPRLQFALVLVVLFGACCVVAMAALRGFLAAGSAKLLLLACGAIALGLSGVMASIGGPAQPNVSVTVHNLMVWVAAWLHFVGTLVGPQRTVNPRLPYLSAGVVLVGAVAVLVAVAAKTGWTPTFFVQGRGGTPLRQFVLGSAIVMFVAAALIMLGRAAAPTKTHLSSFRRWYAWGLLLLALGLAGVWMQRVTNSLLGWTGIGTQLLGACWLMAAAATLASSRAPDRLAMLSAAPRSIALRYVLAALFVGTAAALRLLFGGRTGAVPYDALLPAVLLAALYGGAGPALFAVVLSLVVGEVLWLDRAARFAWGDAAAWVPRAWFAIGSALLVGVALAFQRARERAQAARSDTRWRALFDSLDHGVCVCELICDHTKHPIDYRFLEVNPAFGPMTGLHDAAGKTALELVPTLERRWIDTYARVALKGETLHFEDESVPLGRRFEVYASPIEPRPLFVLRFADVTERRRTEARLAAAAARDAYGVKLATALRPLADPMAVQETAARLLGETLGVQRVAYFEVHGDDYVVERDWVAGLPSIVGRHAIASFGDSLRAAYANARTMHRPDVAADGGLEPAQRAAYAALGIAAHVGVPLVKAGQLVAGLVVHSAAPRHFHAHEVALIEDTAEATWASAERARSEAALREADRRKDEFIATLAHELRNPLAPVRHAAHVLALGAKNAAGATGAADGADRVDRADSADSVAWATDVIERQVRQMSLLIDDLLDVSRISRGLVDLHLDRVELEGVVQDASETTRPLVDEQGHTLVVTLPAEPVVLRADRLRLAQVFANLLDNAAKYSPRGGQIELEATREQTNEGASLVVCVRDQGVGIEPDMLERVFEPFTQGKQGKQGAPHSRGGLGIGLALVRRLVELHGGSVRASSDGLGKGSEFLVRLPLADEPAAPPLQESSEPPTVARSAAGSSAGSGRRVLVVDDNRDGAQSLADLLRLHGHETRVAFDGDEALLAGDAFEPRVVLLDLGMPGKDGWSTVREIRERAWGRAAAVIAVTGWGQPADHARTANAGFDAHLVKPVDPTKLLALLDSAE